MRWREGGSLTHHDGAGPEDDQQLAGREPQHLREDRSGLRAGLEGRRGGRERRRLWRELAGGRFRCGCGGGGRARRGVQDREAPWRRVEMGRALTNQWASAQWRREGFFRMA